MSDSRTSESPGSGGGYWTPLGVTSATVGGISSGTDLGTSPVLVQTTLRSELYPYQGPLVSLSLNPSAGTREIGTSIATPILTPTTTRRTNPITTLTLSRSGTGLIHTYPSPNAAGGTEAPYTDTSGAVSSNTTYTATVGDGTGSGTGTASYAFLPGRYTGVSSSVVSTGAGIISAFGSSVVLTSARTGTFTFDCSVGGGANYCYIAYPTSFGLPSSTLFNGFTFTDYSVSTVSLTNASGFTQNYYILKTNNTYNAALVTWQIL
jgi:hypothetical protein